MAFGGLIITTNGRNALTEAQNGGELKFTRIAIGDGNYTGSFNEIRQLQNEVTSISNINVRTEGSNCIIEADLDNADLETGYYLREIGIFAKHNSKEVLYVYDNAGRDAEYIPAASSAATVEKRLRFTLQISGAENIVAEASSVLYLTQKDFELHANNPDIHISAEQNEKLEGIEEKANRYEHPLHETSAGTFRNVTVDQYGHVIKGNNQTLPISQGGTGAVDEEKARTNLGVPPASHASSGTGYGVATTGNYGHVKVDKGNGLTINNGVIAMDKATNSQMGAVMLSSSLLPENDDKAATVSIVRSLHDLYDTEKYNFARVRTASNLTTTILTFANSISVSASIFISSNYYPADFPITGDNKYEAFLEVLVAVGGRKLARLTRYNVPTVVWVRPIYDNKWLSDWRQM